MNGAVSGILTRNYKVEKPAAFDPYDITVYANADHRGWKDGFNFWAWCEKPDENLTTTKNGIATRLPNARKSKERNGIIRLTKSRAKTIRFHSYSVQEQELHRP